MKTTIRCGRGARLTLRSGTTPESAIACLGSLSPCEADPAGRCAAGSRAVQYASKDRTCGLEARTRRRHKRRMECARCFDR